MTMKSKIVARDDVPALLALLIISVALVSFGADAPAASFTISALIFVLTASSLVFFEDMRLEWWVVPYLMVWVALCSAHFYTGLSADGEHEYLMLLAGGCVYWIGRHGGLSRRRRRRLFNVIAVFAFLFCMFSFFQHMTSPDYVLGVHKQYHEERLTGPFLSANTAATFLAMMLMFLVYRVLRSIQSGSFHSKTQQLPGAVGWLVALPLTVSAILMALSCLFLTASRAAFFAAGIALLVLLFGFALGQNNVGQKRPLSRWLTIFAVMLTIILTVVFMWWLSGSLLESRLETLSDDFLAREVVIKASWKAGELAPVFGNGLNGLDYATAFTSAADTNRFIISQNASHNLFAQWFMQAGWPGLICLVLIIALVLLTTFFGSSDRITKAFRISLLALVCAHGLFDYALEIPAVFLTLCFFVGLTNDENNRVRRESARARG